jgi:23S rRNA (guanine745-N1)-methyltransferase
MTITPFRALACPLDGSPLQRKGAAWRCTAGHGFDIAREAYINLLPVQQKRSRDPGDSKEMVAARRRHLETGSYQPIASAVARAVLADAPAGTALACLDAGCGEGYYLRQLAVTAAARGQSLSLLGLDISKWAVQSAAKQDKGEQANWVVGSNAKLPVLTGSLDRVLCLFGFPVHAEFARVLKPGGRLLQVDAGPDHLRELREIIYPTLKPERTAEIPTPVGFTPRATETLRYSMNLDTPEQIADLLVMTPHFFKANAEGRERAAALQALSLTVEVRLAEFVRTSAC